MAEPVPKSSAEQAKPTNDEAAAASEPPENLPTNAEDRAAAVALSSLNTGTSAAAADDAGGAAGNHVPSKADQEALGQAMSRLETIAAASSGKPSGAAAKKDTAAKKEKEEEKVVKKKPVVKVLAEDVNLLVDQLDLIKPKATELLKSHEGNPIKAIRAFITPPETVQ